MDIAILIAMSYVVLLYSDIAYKIVCLYRNIYIVVVLYYIDKHIILKQWYAIITKQTLYFALLHSAS